LKEVQAVTGPFQEELDRRCPGLLQGLYLVGSVALGDFRPHESDVDYIAVLHHRPGPDEQRALEAALAALPRRPVFEGVCVTWQDLARDPRLCPGGSLVAWHELAWRGLAVRGPARPEVWTDKDALMAFSRQNLEDYWRPWVRGKGRWWSLSAWGASWGVLGVSRLRHLLATGEMTSKTGAGLWARATSPARWHPILDECLRSRTAAPGPAMNPLARRREAVAFVEASLEERL
jgi:hypothetical protein